MNISLFRSGDPTLPGTALNHDGFEPSNVVLLAHFTLGAAASTHFGLGTMHLLYVTHAYMTTMSTSCNIDSN